MIKMVLVRVVAFMLIVGAFMSFTFGVIGASPVAWLPAPAWFLVGGLAFLAVIVIIAMEGDYD